MTFGRLSIFLHIGLSLALGYALYWVGFVYFVPDTESRIRSLLPSQLEVGNMILVSDSEDKGAALFSLQGEAPEMMESFEPSDPRRTTYRRQKSLVSWWQSPIKLEHLIEDGDCSCFSCIDDLQICAIAETWIAKEGSLFYVNPNPNGPSYLLNRENRQLIVAWRRSL